MSSQPKYQVFVSSTFDDLRDERDQVIKAVLEMGHIPVGMEMFSAADEQQWQIIARHIDESDYYAVIVAHRLGSLTPEGTSFTRKEYEYARSKGIPCLGFVIAQTASWPTNRVDTKQSDVAALNDFKHLIKEKPVSFWSSAEDLHGKFSISLMKSVTAQPREGWVRASSATGGAAAAAELVRLSAENGDLRRKLEEAERSAADEKTEEIRRTLDLLFASERTPSYRQTRSGEWLHDSTVTLFDLFRKLGPDMIVECSLIELAKLCAMHIRVDPDKPWDVVAHNQVKEILADFLTLDLVQPSTKKHALSDENEYWRLSPFGVEMLKHVRRVALTMSRAAPDPEEEPGLQEDGINPEHSEVEPAPRSGG